MNIVIFGPQGSGKGTQADMITEKYGLYHMSMGDCLREEIKKKSALGKKIARIVRSGALVPDSITNHMLLLKHGSHPEGVILDGYPRRQAQLDFLIKNIKVDCAIELDLKEKESIRRIASRRMCPKCERGYNLIWLKPKKTGLCDKCCVKLVQRDDDKPKEIKKRLGIYKMQTEPLKKYYQKKGILHIVDGSKSIEQVHKKIMEILDRISPK